MHSDLAIMTCLLERRALDSLTSKADMDPNVERPMLSATSHASVSIHYVLRPGT